MGTQIMVFFSYNGKVLSNKKESTTDSCNNLDESKNIMLNEDSQTEKNTYEMTAFV